MRISDWSSDVCSSDLSWVALSAVGALPLVFSGLGLSYADAFFEAVSGLTTTGSTVLVGLDNLPPGILLWRAMLQWGERQRVVVGKSVSVRVDPGGRR